MGAPDKIAGGGGAGARWGGHHRACLRAVHVNDPGQHHGHDRAVKDRPREHQRGSSFLPGPFIADVEPGSTLLAAARKARAPLEAPVTGRNLRQVSGVA